MSQSFIDDICSQIFSVCNTDEEVSDFMENLISNIKDFIDDREYSPSPSDLKLEIRDNLDDRVLENEVEDEDLEVVKDDEGFFSLR